jgi:RNA polymerase-binding transcription factor DksA
MKIIVFAPSNRPKTEVGTPCEVCGKPLSRGLLRHAPWATTCNRPCFMTKVLSEMPAWQLEADRQLWERHRAGGGR